MDHSVPGNSTKDMKYFGRHTCAAVHAKRPDDIVRAWITRESMKGFGPLLASLAEKKRAYHLVTPEEMETITGSVHHEGVALLVRRPKEVPAGKVMDALLDSKDPVCAVFADGVGNPHNLGSIMRVMSHFGQRFLLGEAGVLPRLSPSAARVSKGGCEHVVRQEIRHVKKFLQQLRQEGFVLATTSSSHDRGEMQSVYDYTWSRRTLLVLGHETKGVSRDLVNMADVHLTLPGAGLVESLNVSVATGILLNEFYRSFL